MANSPSLDLPDIPLNATPPSKWTPPTDLMSTGPSPCQWAQLATAVWTCVAYAYSTYVFKFGPPTPLSPCIHPEPTVQLPWHPVDIAITSMGLPSFFNFNPHYLSPWEHWSSQVSLPIFFFYLGLLMDVSLPACCAT